MNTREADSGPVIRTGGFSLVLNFVALGCLVPPFAPPIRRPDPLSYVRTPREWDGRVRCDWWAYRALLADPNPQQQKNVNEVRNLRLFFKF